MTEFLSFSLMMMMNDIYRKSVLLFVSKMHVCMALVPVIAATLVLVLQRQEINIQGIVELINLGLY